MKRVVVTGMGAVTPIGLNTEEFWEGLREGKTGFSEITQFDTTDFKVKGAASVKGFEGKNYMDVKSAKRMELFCQYAVAAAKEALEQSGIQMEQEDPYRVGCAIGSGVGSLQAMEREHKKMLERGPGRINPLLVPLMITNMAAGNVSIHPLHRRSIPHHPGRRRRRDGGRRNRERHYTHWNRRIYSADSIIFQ